MKHIYLLLLICFPLLGITQENIQILTGTDAAKHIKEAKKIRLNPSSDIPYHIVFNEYNQLSINEFEAFMNTLSDFKIELKIIKKEQDNIGHTHVRFQQYINNIPVEHAIYIAHLKNGKIYSANGNILTKPPLTNTLNISFNKALEQAKKHIGAQQYKWEIPKEEAFLKREQQNQSATYTPQKQLAYIAKNGLLKNNINLSYKLNIYAHKPLSRIEIYIDAANGNVLFENDLIHTADDTAKGISGYSDTVTIITDSISPNNYKLTENNRLNIGGVIETFNLNKSTDHSLGVHFTNSTNFWDMRNPNLDQYAIDAHYGAETTFDYFYLVHGRNSIDNAGFPLRSYVHYDSSYVNAFWDGTRMTYGDGDTALNFTPLTSMSVAGHEITHGLISNSANLIYVAESGALNESFADIFGTTIDFWSRPAKANWLIGDEITSSPNGHFRSMEDPNAKNDPDTYFGNHWHTASSDNYGVHTNSGVQNYWYYLLVNGGTGTNDLGNSYNVTGIGFAKASTIAFRNLTVYLTANSQYIDARYYAIQSAIDLYGNCSPEVEAVTKAWYAVGLGNDYTPTTTANFLAMDTLICRAPHTVFFNNLSNNSTAQTWNFGDGGTSTQPNPIHTYNTPGLYTVQLTANGSGCGGSNTISKTDYIKIIPNDTCPIAMNTNNTITMNNCKGTVFDDGGKMFPYSPNQDSYFTIAPTNATSVTLTIDSFDVESHPNCSYDYMEIYDGADPSAPSLGIFCNNTNPPPNTITSTGGAITIYFHSDPGSQLNGFEISWECQQPTAGIDDADEIISEKIFPNPTTSFVTLKGEYISKQAIKLTLTDALGKIHYQKQFKNVKNLNQTINLESFAKGTYFLMVNNRHYKLIKN